jgi:hypothetical protein
MSVDVKAVVESELPKGYRVDVFPPCDDIVLVGITGANGVWRGRYIRPDDTESTIKLAVQEAVGRIKKRGGGGEND